MANHDHCPVQTIINAVFNGFDGIPEEVAKGVKECDNCFVNFYGPHLTDDLLTTTARRSHTDNFHYNHCEDCQRRYRKTLPNKTGSSHPGYLQNLIS